jgi:hypothetical protein
MVRQPRFIEGSASRAETPDPTGRATIVTRNPRRQFLSIFRKSAGCTFIDRQHCAGGFHGAEEHRQSHPTCCQPDGRVKACITRSRKRTYGFLPGI